MYIHSFVFILNINLCSLLFLFTFILYSNIYIYMCMSGSGVVMQLCRTNIHHCATARLHRRVPRSGAWITWLGCSMQRFSVLCLGV